MSSKATEVPKTARSKEHRKHIEKIKSAAVRSQMERFERAAREAGCDEDPDAFDKALKKVASAPPPRPVKKLKAKKPAK